MKKKKEKKSHLKDNTQCYITKKKSDTYITHEFETIPVHTL